MLFVAPSKTLFELDAEGSVSIQTWAGQEASLPVSDLVAFLHFLNLDSRLLLQPDSQAHADADGLLQELLADLPWRDESLLDNEEVLAHLRPVLP